MAPRIVSHLLPLIQTEAFQRRFDALYEPVPWSGCWIWMGSTNNRGYGWISVRGPQLAHRVSYMARHGTDLSGKVAMHICDTPACVNPDHIVAGTQMDNMRDMAAKGRNRTPRQRAKSPGGYRTKGGRVRKPLPITDADAMRIAARVRHGEAQHKIGAEYGITQQQVSLLISGKHWQFPQVSV